MIKKRLLSLYVLIIGLIGICVFGVIQNNNAYDKLESSGYINIRNNNAIQLVSFEDDTKIKSYKQGYVEIDAIDGKTVVEKETFIHLNNGSVTSFADATLVDFNDLSDNFINYYYIPSGLEILDTGSNKYTAQTSDSTSSFGENLMKITDNKYIIRSNKLVVHLAENNEFDVDDYVQVEISEDGIASIINEDKEWTTISEDAYIKTENGVEVYPIQQLITDGTYKLSLAKITVNPDDTIVLTEGETRRQIVPEINIETIDGKDGTAGTDAKNGTDGTNGTDAENGKNGINGGDGINAKNGIDGEDGDPGTDAKKGTDGSNASGTSTTNSALPSMTFTDWNVTTNSLKGIITIVDESGFLSDIDSDENVENYPATVIITNNNTGENIYCYSTQFSRDGQTQKTTYKEPDTSSTNIKDIYKSEEVGFSTNGNILEPNTSYTVSVSAYYLANETVYHREFISRTFFTDSTGILVEKDSSSQDSISAKVSLSNAAANNVDRVRVFLLTEAQKNTFNLSEVQNKLNDYTYVEIVYGTTSNAVVLHRSDGTSLKIADKVDNKSLQNIIFDELNSNRTFYLKTYAEYGSTKTFVGNEIEVQTLKQAPYYTVVDPTDKTKTKNISIGVTSSEITETVTAYYNRVTGGFEVYRPTMYDPDAGIVRFKYIAKEKENPTNIKTKYLYPSESEPAVFYLESETEYIFDVEVEFFDNEKTIYFDTLDSPSIMSYGSTLPKMILTTDNKTSSTFDGTLQIKLDDQNTTMYIDTKDPDHYLQLDIYADGIYDQTIQIKNESTPYKSENQQCVATYTRDKQTNYVNVALDFERLCQNTNYTITVTGCIDLNDTNGAIRRGLGTVSFFTKKMDTLQAKLTTTSSPDASIAVNLKLLPTSTTTEEDTNFATSMIQNGELSVGLYSGTNKNKRLIVSTTLSGNSIEDITTDGILITERTFGSTTVNANAEYTIVVESMTDNTCEVDLDYVNYFDLEYPNYVTLNADGVLPDLFEDPTRGVTVLTITNLMASDYGGVYNSALPDDAIVGYKVTANYDNTGRMGKRIRYYAFEWSDFVQSMFDGIDPIGSNSTIDYESGQPKTNRLYQVELEVPDSNEVPSVTFLFGNDPSTKAPTTNEQRFATYKGGAYRFYVGNATTVGNQLKSGMARGYRYVFAYDLTYEKKSNQEEQRYPYDYSSVKKGNYSSYVQYGAGVLNGVTIINSTRQVYVLNSGMVEAPCTLPGFNTYVYDTEFSSTVGGVSSGYVTIHYHYEDPDGLISESGSNATTVSWGTKESDLLVSTEAGRIVSNETGNKWYSLKIPFSVSKSVNLYTPCEILEVKVNITRYSPVKSDKYVEMLTKQFNYSETDLIPEVYLDIIPIDYNWQDYFGSVTNSTALKLEVDSSTLTQNYFNILINKNNSDKEFIRAAKQKTAFAVIKTQIVDGSYNPVTGVDPDYFNIPITYTNIDNDSNISIKLTTGTLGSKYLNKLFTIEVALYYEDGYEGVTYANNPNEGIEGTDAKYFVSKYYSVEDKSVTYTGYSRAYTTTDAEVPNYNAIVAKNLDLAAKLRKVLKLSEKVSLKDYKFLLTQKQINYYSYPYHYGTMLSAGSSLDSPVTNYDIFKQLSAYNVYTDEPVVVQLNNVVPTISNFGASVTPSTASIKLFECKGIDSIDGTESKKIGIRLYNSKSAAQTLSASDVASDKVYISITGDNLSKDTYSFNSDTYGKIEFDGLSVGGTYYAVLFAEINGKEIPLLDYSTADYAVYRITTTSSLSVTLTKCNYYNYSYFDKKLEINYLLSSPNAAGYRYDIYSSLAEAEADDLRLVGEPGNYTCVHSEDCQPIVTYEQLCAMNAMYEPDYNTTGSVTLKLLPSELRKTLQSGNTYAVRMTAYDKTGKTNTILGSSSSEFSIPINNGVSAVTSLIDATRSSITYQVTITDNSYLIMGSQEYQSGAGLYTVRFTYDYTDPVTKNTYERLLITDYDGKVYPTNSSGLKKQFVLNNDHLVYYQDGKPIYDGQEIKSGVSYKIHIFAVCDFDEDGLSEITTLEGNTSKKTWDYFYSDIQADGLCSVFNTFVDTFWPITAKPSYASDTYVQGIRELYEIGTASQRTLKAGETYYLNKDYAQFQRIDSSKIALVLTESFNIASNNNKTQAFSKIAYSISGLDQNGNAVSKSGESSALKGDNLFIERTVYGYKAFEYTIPTTLSKGRYWITMKFYEPGQIEPAITLSKAFQDN